MQIRDLKYQNGLCTIKTNKGQAAARIEQHVELEKKEFVSLNDTQSIQADNKTKEAIIQTLLATADYSFDSFENVKQIPRPITIFFENSQCQIGTTSLDEKSISKAVWANEYLYKRCKKQLSKQIIQSTESTEQVCKRIYEQISKATEEIGSTIKIAIVCKKPQKKEELIRLIKKYDITYIENPFDNNKEYQACTKEIQHRCFIAPTFEPKERISNAVATKKINITNILKIQQEKRFIQAVHTKTKRDVHIATAAKVPLIIYNIDNKEVPQTIQQIEKIIKSSNQNKPNPPKDI